MEKFWTWFGHVDNLLEVLTAMLAAGSFLLLWRQNRRLRELARQMPRVQDFAALCEWHAGVKSSAPVALALSLVATSESIKTSVETFLRVQGWQMLIEELSCNGRTPKPT